MPVNDDPELPWYKLLLVYFSFLVLVGFGYLNEFVDKWILMRNVFQTRKGYASLFKDWESFYTRRMYKRIRDCWARDVAGVPSAWIEVAERYSDDRNDTYKYTGKTKRCLNLGSYNYLGFSDIDGPCVTAAKEAMKKYGVSTTASVLEGGYLDLHRAVEKRMARFLKKEDCIIFGMGYATNASTIPAIVGKGCLVISDSFNHASLVAGCRSSGAKIKTFEHQDTVDLERVVRQAIIEGQPRTHRPWRKILIIVEGIYSMEGEICPLREIVRIKNKYKCYLWVDEAHSIGALGPTGRGVTDETGVPTSEVDILMGTFTKSYASVGGYITGPTELIEHLRHTAFASVYSTSMSPAATQQILSALTILMGEDGTTIGRDKVRQLRENSNFFRKSLVDRGFQIFGDQNSPVIPLMIYFPAKISSFSRECLARNIAVVVVGFPATSLLMARTRFCVSAGHTREDLEWALKQIDEIGDKLGLKYGNRRLKH